MFRWKKSLNRWKISKLNWQRRRGTAARPSTSAAGRPEYYSALLISLYEPTAYCIANGHYQSRHFISTLESWSFAQGWDRKGVRLRGIYLLPAWPCITPEGCRKTALICPKTPSCQHIWGARICFFFRKFGINTWSRLPQRATRPSRAVC